MSELKRKQLRALRTLLENPYAGIEQIEEAEPIRLASNPSFPVQVERRTLSRSEIRAHVERIHRELWLRRREIFPDRESLDPIDLLDPSIALQIIGYSCEVVDDLGEIHQQGRRSDAAGQIDSYGKSVKISSRQLLPVQRFTAAHELAHAVLHSSAVTLHRDLPIDSSSPAREPVEVEANQFATEFLMPPNLMREHFCRRFLCEPWSLNEETAFALGFRSLRKAEAKCSTMRKLALYLADATYFNGKHFKSLAEQFKVSKLAMAIRIEELGFVVVGGR